MWVFYSLFFALWGGIHTLIAKKLTKIVDPLPLSYAFLAFGIPITFLLLLFLGGIPEVTSNFYLNIGVAGFLDAIAFYASFSAIKRSSISLIAPVASFSPVFTTFIAIFALHEVPTAQKFIGILLVVVGAYLLNIADVKEGIMEPFKKLFSDKGVLLFLLANLLWAVTPIFQKKAIFEIHPQIPLFASVVNMCFAFLFLTPFALKKAIASFREIKMSIKWLVFNGIGTAFSQAAAYAAFALVFVGYSTSIFKLSSVFIIIFGGVFLKEERIKERILGASVMILGTILLAL